MPIPNPQVELAVLRKLGAADPDNRKHCIRLLRHFEYRNHVCLVFEPMAMNLRDLTKKYGRNKVGWGHKRDGVRAASFCFLCL